jgi:hypothetical protein
MAAALKSESVPGRCRAGAAGGNHAVAESGGAVVVCFACRGLGMLEKPTITPTSINSM